MMYVFCHVYDEINGVHVHVHIASGSILYLSTIVLLASLFTAIVLAPHVRSLAKCLY